MGTVRRYSRIGKLVDTSQKPPDGYHVAYNAATDECEFREAASGPGGAHATSHQNNGADEINVAGLSGRLADPQTPATHTHAPGDVTGTAVITSDARLSDARAPLSHSHVDADLPAGLARDSEVTAAITAHAGTNTHAQIDSHLASTANPHGTTAAQAGALATTAFSGLAKITVGTSAPGSPSVGDLWIDSN